MDYHVARNGQTYGPYSLETVQKYLSEGSIQASDMARTDAMPNWLPLGQLVNPPAFAAPVAPVIQPPLAYQQTPAYQQPAGYQPSPVYSPQATAGNAPPSLHWIIVLLLNFVTGGIFVLVWVFVQASFIKTIDRSSSAMRDFIVGFALGMVGFAAFFIILVTSVGLGALASNSLSVVALGGVGLAFLVMLGFIIGAIVFHMKAVFGMRDSMVRHYNTVEPINLRLSTIMTMFFNIFYFQYHFTRIAEWKRTGVLQPQQ